MNNIINMSGIYEKGYGNISKLVMQDKRLHIYAKCIYSYFCSYTGGGTSCFPARSKICSDLEISAETYQKYLKQLTNYGYVTVEQVKENGKFAHNVYTLNQIISKSTVVGDTVHGVVVHGVVVHGEIDTNNNNINNNNINNNIINNIYSPAEQDNAPAKKQKHTYGAYKNVKLTDDEYQKLQDEYGNADELIKHLDEAIEMKGYKYKSHYLAIRKWVVDAVREKKLHKSESIYEDNTGYDYDSIEEIMQKKYDKE